MDGGDHSLKVKGGAAAQVGVGEELSSALTQWVTGLVAAGAAAPGAAAAAAAAVQGHPPTPQQQQARKRGREEGEG